MRQTVPSSTPSRCDDCLTEKAVCAFNRSACVPKSATCRAFHQTGCMRACVRSYWSEGYASRSEQMAEKAFEGATGVIGIANNVIEE